MAWYPYSYKTAFDPATRSLAPAGSVGQVYAVGDTDFTTPLVTHDLTGLPVELSVQGEAGYIPSFQVEDQTSVIWKSGEYVLELTTTMPLPGPTGARIVDAVDNGDGTISFTLSDGSTVGPVTVPEGPQGERGPAGYNATGAVEDQQTLADYVAETAGPNPFSGELKATFASTHVANDSLQSAIDRAETDGGGLVTLPAGGTAAPPVDILLPRTVNFVGQGARVSKLNAATPISLKPTGGGGWDHLIQGIEMNGVGIVAGDTSADYANGLTVRDMDIFNVENGLTFRHNAWLTRVENARIHNCVTGIKHDFLPVTANSGANMVYSNSVVFDCTGAGFWQDDKAIDGWHVSMLGMNIEHCAQSIRLSNVGDGTLDLEAFHGELNTESYILADSGYIVFGSGWIMGLQAGNVAMFDLSGTARVEVLAGRIGWSASTLLGRVSDTASLRLDAERILASPLGPRVTNATSLTNPLVAGSTGVLKLPAGYVKSRPITDAITVAGATTTIVGIPPHTGNDVEATFSVTLPTSTAGNIVRVYLNPGTGGGYIDLVFPDAATSAEVRVLVNRNVAHLHAIYNQGTVYRSKLALSHTLAQNGYVDAQVVAGGQTATVEKVKAVML